MKKDTAGVAGAARIDQLSMAELTHAELHGKRLDKTSKSRAINNEPPLTTTGLDLKTLYHVHVAGAFIPKSRAKAMQVVIQFPKDLVNGDDAALMLQHGRTFLEGVFGTDAIFADRVDRDEQSRHVVDFFIAPKYVKKTKHQEKVAVTMSRHQKELAEKYNCPPTPIGTGRALQDALFEYLRDQMHLSGVKRGEPKLIPGPDWKSAEQLRSEELDDLATQVQERAAQVGRDQTEAHARRADAEAAHIAADAIAQSVADDRHALDRDREAHRRRQAELARRERQLREAEDVVRVARSELQRRQDNLTVTQRLIDRATEIARERTIAMMEASASAEADRIAAAKSTALADADRAAIADERVQREAELALLMKASDDAHGLNLRLSASHITLNEEAMDQTERSTYRRVWPAPVRALAVRLATALERVRELTRALLAREARISAKELAVSVRERELEERQTTQRADLEKALAALTVREDAATLNAHNAERRAAMADARMSAAMSKENDAVEALAVHENWAKAIEIIGKYPSILIHDSDGGFRLDRRPERTGKLPEWLAATLEKPAPAWAQTAIKGLHQRERATERLEARERLAASHLEQLQDMIAAAGPALQPAQRQIAERANNILRRVGPVIHLQDDGHAM